MAPGVQRINLTKICSIFIGTLQNYIHIGTGRLLLKILTGATGSQYIIWREKGKVFLFFFYFPFTIAIQLEVFTLIQNCWTLVTLVDLTRLCHFWLTRSSGSSAIILAPFTRSAEIGSLRRNWYLMAHVVQRINLSHGSCSSEDKSISWLLQFRG